MPLSLPSALPAALRVLAILALAAGVGAWGSILLAPRPGPLPPAVSGAGGARAAPPRPRAGRVGNAPAQRPPNARQGV
jgi:general secretion pathway protein C